MNPLQLKDLSDELAALWKQQSDASFLEPYIRMTNAEAEAFDLRAQRISKIYVMLNDHDSKR